MLRQPKILLRFILTISLTIFVVETAIMLVLSMVELDKTSSWVSSAIDALSLSLIVWIVHHLFFPVKEILQTKKNLLGKYDAAWTTITTVLLTQLILTISSNSLIPSLNGFKSVIYEASLTTVIAVLCATLSIWMKLYFTSNFEFLKKVRKQSHIKGLVFIQKTPTIVLLLCALAITAHKIYLSNNQSIDEKLVSEQTDIIELSENITNEHFRLILEDIKVYANTFTELNKHNRLNSFGKPVITAMLNNKTHYEYILVIDPQGNVIINASKSITNVESNKKVIENEFFSQIFEKFNKQRTGEDMYISPIEFSKVSTQTNQPAIRTLKVFKRLQTKDGNYAGALIVSVRTDDLFDKIIAKSKTVEINSLIIDGNGTKLYQSKPEGQTSTISFDKIRLNNTLDNHSAKHSTRQNSGGVLNDASGISVYRYITPIRSANRQMIAPNSDYYNMPEWTLIQHVPNRVIHELRTKEITEITFATTLGYIFILCYFWTTVNGETDRIELIIKLKESKNKADLANESKSRFLATMSHEIRTPITAILGFSNMLLSYALPADCQEKISKIEDSSRHLLNILNDILDMSKIDAKKLVITPIDFDIHCLITDVIELFDFKPRTNTKKSVSIEAIFSDDFPKMIHCDPIRLRQVLINLLGNSIKFTHQGQIKIVCTRSDSNAPKAQEMLHIEVTDTGIGIAPEAIDTLFESFTQADASINRQYAGTGLGLAISKNLVELMGGKIGVKSSLKKGSTFWFDFPYLEPKELGQPIQNAPRGDVTFKARRSLNILAAEDNPEMGEILRFYLTKFGHTVCIVQDGRELILEHINHEYDLIITDVRMPLESGPEATRKIRALEKPKSQIPIIFLTADSIEENQAAYISSGADAVVLKPIETQKLSTAIDHVLAEDLHESVIQPPYQLPTQSRKNDESILFELIEKIGLPEQSAKQLLINFAVRYSNVVENIENGLEHDPDTALRTAHSLAGLSGTLKLESISRSAKNLEHAISKQQSAEIQLQLNLLQEALLPTLQLIKNMKMS